MNYPIVVKVFNVSVFFALIVLGSVLYGGILFVFNDFQDWWLMFFVGFIATLIGAIAERYDLNSTELC